MYKVFVNDKPLFIGDDKKISTNLNHYKFAEKDIIDLVHKLFSNTETGILLSTNKLSQDWLEFKKMFTTQKAAGGKVVNLKGEVLFIYRNQKWDLPKGKIEKGETIEECAIREVEEECGISGLKIVKELETTYHIFQKKDEYILKITYWYLMNVEFSGQLKPQEEEGIEEVCFKDLKSQNEAMKNTYSNLKLLFHH